MSYVAQRMPDCHQAEDIVQEAFLRLFRAAASDGYSGRAGVATWLFTIAENCATDYLRAAGRRRLVLESDVAGEDDRARRACSTVPPRTISIPPKRPHAAKAKAEPRACSTACPRNNAASWPLGCWAG